MRTLIGLITVFLLALPAQASVFRVSEAQINDYLSTHLEEKVPLQNSVGFAPLVQFDYRLDKLRTQIGRTAEKRVNILGTLDGVLQLKGKRYPAVIELNLATLPYFSAEKGELFLQDLQLKQWRIQPEKYQAQAKHLLPFVLDGLRAYFNRMPVYTLNEQDTQEALFKKFGKAIKVEEGELQLEAGLF